MATYGSPAPKKNNRPLFIVLGTVFGVLALAVCGCVGVVASAGDSKKERPGAPAAVTSGARSPAGAVTSPAVPASVAPGTTAPATTAAAPTVAATTAAAPPPVVVPTTEQPPAPEPTKDTTDAYYKNCAEARAAGAAPLYRGDPGYREALDRDKDGVACE